MPITRLQIDPFLELAEKYPVLDVRSPGEFKHAHIPNAYSLPLFSDEERTIVGTTYKQESREKAIKVGLDFFGVKMRKMVEEVESLVQDRDKSFELRKGPGQEIRETKTVLVHCWRGGMRSAGVAWLLDLYGFKVYTLTGGYKRYRNHVLETFRRPWPIRLVGGYTGSGKTTVLHEMEKMGNPVIDLEKMAGHKGSAFGNLDRHPQPGQEMFENLLSLELQKLQGNDVIWMEDESQRIGLVNLPHELWKTLRVAPLYFLDIPFEQRLQEVVRVYGGFDREKLIEAIGRICEKLGHLNAKTAILLLNEGKITESFEILLKYYDKLYLKSLHNREGVNALLHTIKSSTVTPENAKLIIPQPNFATEKI